MGGAGPAAADPSRVPEGFDGGLNAENDFETPDATYPYGTHLAVVEVDTETGLAKLVRHVTVDDAGTITNPLLVEGQVHGGIAQGVAQALFEEIAYDEDGNNVTGSLASYAIPSAGDLPTFETERTQTPTPRNPLGAKGIGEAGAIGSTPAVWNAVVDALSPPRRAQHRHAGHAAAGVAGDQRSSVSAAVRASMSSVVVPTPRLALTAPGSSGSRPAWSSACRRSASASVTPSRRVSSGCAQKQPWRTPIACSALRISRQRAVLVAREVEARDAHPVGMAGPQLIRGEAGDRRQARVQIRAEQALLLLDGRHVERVAGRGEGDGADHVRRAGLEALGRVGPDHVVDGDELDRAAALQQRAAGDSGVRLTSAPAPNGA